MTAIERYQRIADRELTHYRTARLQVKQENRELRRARRQLRAAEKAQRVLQEIAQKLQTQAHQRISNIVTRCLEAIWGEEAYGFEFRFERKRGKTEAVPLFLRNGQVIDDPLRASGGGPVQIAAFALRVAAIVLTRPSKRRLVVTDEPFLALDKQRIDRVGQMLKQLSDDLDLQIIMVTHTDAIKIGKILEL